MNWKRVKLLLLSSSVLALGYFIIARPEVLAYEAFGKTQLPAGTLISWCALIAYSLLFYVLFSTKLNSKAIKRIRTLLLANVILSVLWGVLSFLLAGNWSFSFQNSSISFKIWIGLTIVIVVAPLLIWLTFLILKVSNR